MPSNIDAHLFLSCSGKVFFYGYHEATFTALGFSTKIVGTQEVNALASLHISCETESELFGIISLFVTDQGNIFGCGTKRFLGLEFKSNFDYITEHVKLEFTNLLINDPAYQSLLKLKTKALTLQCSQSLFPLAHLATKRQLCNEEKLRT